MKGKLADLGRRVAKGVGEAVAAPPKKRQRQGEAMTGISLPAETLKLLRLVAIARATAKGEGRPSVSAVIVELVERHRSELESELR